MGSNKDQQQFYSVLETLTETELLEVDFEVDEVGIMVLDKGCLKTVTGKLWFDDFVDSLDLKTRRMISAQESENIFEFGEGVRRKSIGLFSIPCSVAGHDIFFRTDVVE